MALKIYTPSLIPGRDPHPLLAFRFGVAVSRGVFNEDQAENFFKKEAIFVEHIEYADIVLLPHNFATLDSATRAYIAKHADMAERIKIPVHVFSFADLNDRMRFDPRVIVFRLSGYQSSLCVRDIIVPTTVREFDEEMVVYRKKNETPIVSFCGFAGYKTMRQWVMYGVKNFLWDFRALVNPVMRAHKLGIYWRRIAMRALEKSPLVQTDFIVRKSFSAAVRTIELSPAKAREEFLNSIVKSDFVLAPKGDGNYSNRFIEVLALGRIPVIIDTDIALPLEGVVDYDSIIVRVPMNRIHDVAQYIRDFYDVLGEEEWRDKQRLARATYEQYLRQSSFFSYYFSHRLHIGHV